MRGDQVSSSKVYFKTTMLPVETLFTRERIASSSYATKEIHFKCLHCGVIPLHLNSPKEKEARLAKRVGSRFATPSKAYVQ